jgi:hypothetical protein
MSRNLRIDISIEASLIPTIAPDSEAADADDRDIEQRMQERLGQLISDELESAGSYSVGTKVTVVDQGTEDYTYACHRSEVSGPSMGGVER